MLNSTLGTGGQIVYYTSMRPVLSFAINHLLIAHIINMITILNDDVESNHASEHYKLFLSINVTEKNFCHMENRAHNFGTKRLALFSFHWTSS